MTVIDVLHLRQNNIMDLHGNIFERIMYTEFVHFRPASAHGGGSARLGSHRPESRAYGNFDHQQAIYTNRHGNLLV